MTRISLPEGDLPDAARVIGLHPQLGQAMAAMSAAIYGELPISLREREVIRMKVAQINNCQICLGFRFPELEAQGVTEQLYQAVETYKASKQLSDREKLAIEYTEKYLLDHENITDAFFNKLKSAFSSEEIFAISAIIGGLLMNGRLLRVMQIDTSCDLPLNNSL